MLDYVLLGRMKAEFEAACRAIDERANTAESDMLKSAWSALLDGNTVARDRVLGKHGAVTDARNKAKKEAWYRIGEKHGLSRETADAAIKRIYQ